jgi:hypothetical protein
MNTSQSRHRDILIYEQSYSNNTPINNDSTTIDMSAPRFVTIVVSFRAIYTVYITQGMWLGVFSAILTLICVAPLFNVSTRENMPTPVQIVAVASEAILPSMSVPFTGANFQELTISHHNDNMPSALGRTAQHIIETLKECVDDLNYVAQVLLRENQGLLLLLVGGVSTMALALVAGLDGVNGIKAVLISITCYGVTTILVARSARRIVNQQTTMMISHKPILSSAQVTRIVEAIPEEKFVRNDDLGICDWNCLTDMLHHRKPHQSTKYFNSNTSNCTENVECTSLEHNPHLMKEALIAEIQQRRNYNDSCCICLSPFAREERIRVLPSCQHEFHVYCIDKWAQTFAADKIRRLRLDCHVKSGNPTCPLCKTCL